MSFWLIVFFVCVLLAAVVNGWCWLARRRKRKREHAPIRGRRRAWPGKPVDGRPLDDYESRKLKEIAGDLRNDKEAAR